MKLSKRFWIDRIVAELIGEDVERYKALLGQHELKDLHLKPLLGKPGEKWAEKVELALNHGYSPCEIADHATGFSAEVISGDGVAHWQERIDSLPATDEDNSGLKQVVDLCRRHYEDQKQRSLEKEEHEAIHGRRW